MTTTPVRACAKRCVDEVHSPQKSKAEKQRAEDAQLEQWLRQNRTTIAKAENLLHERWADRKLFHEQMPLCDKVLQVMKAVLSSGGGAGSTAESKSVLVLGEPGSGKTQAVDWCLQRLKEEHSSLVALRARGDAYASNVECLRHLAAQVAGQLVCVPQQSSSFEESMEWFRRILRDSFKRDSAVVIVLDRFEHFCCLARQTLLYNLFNLAQDLSVRLCIVGISEKFNVTGSLEKRIMSRFSMQHLFAFLPETTEELVQVLERKLHLPEDCKLGKAFTQQFNLRVTASLKLQAPGWRSHLEAGRHPSWFLCRCLPVAALLRSGCAASDEADATASRQAALRGLESPQKRARHAGGVLGGMCDTEDERRHLMLSGLAECEHLVLLALFRQQDRSTRAVRSLSTVLHELMALVESSGGVLTSHTEDSFSAAFYRLVQCQLVRFGVALAGTSGGAASDLPKRYLACESCVDNVYAAWAVDLEKCEPTIANNPLRALPQPVQLWAMRQRS